MKREELGGPILASVSRSFYLTIRVLPAELQGPIGLAYLLARTSDTIADSTATPVATRIELLAAFEKMAVEGTTAQHERLAAEIFPEKESERVLLRQVRPCLEWLQALEPGDREKIQDVLRKIIHGQTLDLRRFGETHAGAVRALQNAAELEEYTYLVAGCVGEFWTRICQAHLPRYSRRPAAEMEALGVRFGQGLQLVNILRDLPEDLRQGRCYLPSEELAAVGARPENLLAEPASGRVVFERWVARAREFLHGGADYIAATRPARIRAGCFLPWYLGEKTLRLIEERNPLASAQRVKVSRQVVYGGMPRALLAAFSDRPLRA